MFIREEIPSKLIESNMIIKGFFVELNLKRKKWLLCFSYNPKFSQIIFHLNELGKNLDTLTSKYDNIILLGDFNTKPTDTTLTLTSKYDNIILLGDFNTKPTDTTLSNFCEIFNLKNLIKDNNCFKNPNKPSCIDLMITNRPKSSQNSMVIETGLSDFHKMCITVMKMYYSREKPFIIHYRKFKDFNNDAFIKDLKTFLSKSFYEETISFQAL